MRVVITTLTIIVDFGDVSVYNVLKPQYYFSNIIKSLLLNDC
jgi:hypothetical protein